MGNEWCEHIETKYGHTYLTNKYYHFNGWKFCPICGEEKPKPQDEIELDALISDALFNSIYFQDSGISIKTITPFMEHLKWKILAWHKQQEEKA